MNSLLNRIKIPGRKPVKNALPRQPLTLKVRIKEIGRAGRAKISVAKVPIQTTIQRGTISPALPGKIRIGKIDRTG